MFTLPPLPPKDYVLKVVNQNQRSAQEHTPLAQPRITQSSLGIFCSPIQYEEHDRLNEIKSGDLNSQILKRLTDRARAFWVDKPGKNDYFLHDMYKNYSVDVWPSYDARYKHKEQVLYRSFKYEFDCTDSDRLQKVYRKMDREESEAREEIEQWERKRIEQETKKTIDDMGLKKCAEAAPFWWKVADEESIPEDSGGAKISQVNDYCSSALRWHEHPDLLETAREDACLRRKELAKYVIKSQINLN